MKQAILIYGTESGGNRLLGRLMIAAGCIGDPGHEQRWEQAPPADEDRIVWVRSFPLTPRHLWPSIEAQVWMLRERGYECFGLVASRDWQATAASQIATGHVARTEDAYANMMHALTWIFGGLHRTTVPFHVLHYSDLVRRPLPTINEALRRIGMEPLKELPEPIVDGDAKHVCTCRTVNNLHNCGHDDTCPCFGLTANQKSAT